MRLLNAKTLKLEDFPGKIDVKYTILSHTWSEEEVLFADIQNCAAGEWERKAGAQKVKISASLALRDGCNYIWIDTCCIDKSSSAELSESINSMYRWYQRASVCYAYLSDATLNVWTNQGAKCRWFSRGWTLQELIAPPHVKFYDRDWKPIGSRDSLANEIEQITSIDIELLKDGKGRSSIHLDQYSVCQRMKWATFRQTTRSEDAAYSLLGIFDVNMALLYGEGRLKAFRRLQEEILKRTHDQSILVRDCVSYDWEPNILARSPDDFRHSPVVRRKLPPPGPKAIRLTPNGLEVCLYLCPAKGDDTRVVGILDCYADISQTWAGRLAIVIRRVDEYYCLDGRSGQYVVRPDREGIAFPIWCPETNERAVTFYSSRMRQETITLRSQSYGLSDKGDYHILPPTLPPLRLKPIAQATTTTYSFGPSLPERASSLITPSIPLENRGLINIENIISTDHDTRTTAIIAVTAELLGTISYPLLLHFQKCGDANGILLEAMTNMYSFPTEAQVTGEMLKEAVHHPENKKLSRRWRGLKDPVVLSMYLPDGNVCIIRLVKRQWFGQELLDLEIVINYNVEGSNR